jgi:hypothetical protein
VHRPDDVLGPVVLEERVQGRLRAVGVPEGEALVVRPAVGAVGLEVEAEVAAIVGDSRLL